MSLRDLTGYDCTKKLDSGAAAAFTATTVDY